MYFPPSAGSSFASFSSGDSRAYFCSSHYISFSTHQTDTTALKLSAARQLAVQGNVVAHVIPSVRLPRHVPLAYGRPLTHLLACTWY